MVIRSWPAADPIRRVYLMSGSVCVAATPTLVTTILGSCIAVCLWDPVSKAGGMNHFVLPANDFDDDHSARYGDTAIDHLADGLLGLGCRIEHLQAKLFGGAAVLRFGAAAMAVGERNLAMALDRLRAYGIPVVARRTGGEHGLLIRLHTGTGEVFLRNLAARRADTAFDARPGCAGPALPVGRVSRMGAV